LRAITAYKHLKSTVLVWSAKYLLVNI